MTHHKTNDTVEAASELAAQLVVTGVIVVLGLIVAHAAVLVIAACWVVMR